MRGLRLSFTFLRFQSIGRRLRLSSLALLVAFALLLLPPASGAIKEQRELMAFDVKEPVKIAFSYAYTKNVTISVVPLGASLWTSTIGPQQTIFTTNATDRYDMEFKIGYTQPQPQTVTMAVWSGDVLIFQNNKYTDAQVFVLAISLTTGKPVHYPTPEEISNTVLQKWEERIAQFGDQIYALAARLDKAEVNVVSIGYAAAAISIVALGGAVYSARKSSAAEGMTRAMGAPPELAEKVREALRPDIEAAVKATVEKTVGSLVGTMEKRPTLFRRSLSYRIRMCLARIKARSKGAAAAVAAPEKEGGR